MWQVFQTFVTRRHRRENERKAAWQAACSSQASADQAFEDLDNGERIAIEAKNRAMRLMPSEALAIEADWNRQQEAVRDARQKYGYLAPIADQYIPQAGLSIGEYQKIRVSYDNLVRLSDDVDGQLEDFTLRCEDISFSPAGLRAWTDELFDSDARLERLRQNMVTDGSDVPPHADVDELHGFMREAEVLLHSEDYDELRDQLAVAEQVAQSLEEQFEVHLRFGDYKQLLFTDVSRQVKWTERHTVSSQIALTELIRTYGMTRVDDVAQGLGDAPVWLAKARTMLAKTASMIAAPSRTKADVTFELQSVVQLCWNVDLVCNAVTRRARDLARERDKHTRDHAEPGPGPSNDEG